MAQPEIIKIRQQFSRGIIPAPIKKDIETRFKKGMTWDNYGFKWQIYPAPDLNNLHPRWLKNPQRPYNQSTKVEPIRRQVDIDRIKSLLADQPRNLALFTFGINTNLRASDLAHITVDQVKDLQPGDSFEIMEKKTGKSRWITLNIGLHHSIHNWITTGKLEAGSPFFRSQRRGRKNRFHRLTVSSINRLVKGWCSQISLKGNYGSHTLRKTWGYHAYKAGIDLPRLMTCFNHSNQKQTLDYLCIQDSEIKDVYLQVEL
jgi:integrase